MKRTRGALILATLVASAPVFSAGVARAGEGGEVDEARTRFQRGVDLYKEGSFDAALAEFTKAYELSPNYRVLYNIAQVQSERHDYVAAVNLFEKYLREGGAEIAVDRRDQVTREITALKGKVSQLTVSADAEGAELLVDGVSAGTLPLNEPLLVNAGVRQLQVRKTGYETSTRSETIAGGDTVHLDFKLKAAPTAPILAPAPTTLPASSTENADIMSEPEHAPSRVPFWITLTSTALLTGGAVTFGVLTNNANQNLDHELGRFPSDSGSISNARSTLKRDALLTDIFTGAAVVSGGFCLYFALTTGSRHTSEKSMAVVKTLKVGAAGPGVRFLGTF
jgi:hypothetical protein